MDQQPQVRINEQGQPEVAVFQVVDEAQLQAEADASQNELNARAAELEQAKQTVANLEATLDEASKALDAATEAHQAAETANQKSTAVLKALADARELAASQPQSAEGEGSAEDATEPADSEAVEVPVTVAG